MAKKLLKKNSHIYVFKPFIYLFIKNQYVLKFDIYLKSCFIHIVNQFPSPLLSLSLSLSLVLNISSLLYPDSSLKNRRFWI
jgi:hypothetical protein